MEETLEWLEELRLSRSCRSIGRDFSDAVLMAEVLKHYFPSKVDSHAYRSANSTVNKLKNWQWLNSKTLKSLGLERTDDTLLELANGKQDAMLDLLQDIRKKVAGSSDHGVVPGGGSSSDIKTELAGVKAKLDAEGRKVAVLEAKVAKLEKILKESHLEDLMLSSMESGRSSRRSSILLTSPRSSVASPTASVKPTVKVKRMSPVADGSPSVQEVATKKKSVADGPPTRQEAIKRKSPPIAAKAVAPTAREVAKKSPSVAVDGLAVDGERRLRPTTVTLSPRPSRHPETNAQA